MLCQTAQFTGLPAERLYQAFLSAKEHAAMTADGAQLVTFFRPTIGEAEVGQVGDELRAFGIRDPKGAVSYRLTAKLLHLVPGQVIVMAWRSAAWMAAVNATDVTDLDSTVVLTFKPNMAGSEVQLVQANVPGYKARIPDTGEEGPLSEIVNTHWSLLYWEPMRRYFAEAR